MSTEKRLKEKLRLVRQNNYDISKDEINLLVPQMLENLGSIDSELRDKLIYSTFYMWIMGEKFTPNELKELLDTVLSESYLFYNVGEINSISVFKRSFSILIVALVLSMNQKTKFLDDREILEVYEKLIDYFDKERDYKGYDIKYGWAHSIAHAADAFDEIVKYEIIDKDKLLAILQSFKEKIQIDHYVFINGEDERLVIAVYTLFKRNILETIDIHQWIDELISYPKKKVYPEDNMILMNVKCFLRSLFFRIVNDENYYEISSYIKNKLEYIDEYK